MSQSCARWRGDIGAYIVDALDSPARDRVTRHLAVCAGCRADYDELVVVRGWLDALAPPARPRPGGLAPAPPRRHRPVIRPVIRPGTRRWLPVAGTAVLAAAAATVALLVGGPGTPARTFRATDSATGVSGYAQLHATPAGTQISLTASGLPSSGRCILIAVTRGGSDIAGSWAATYRGSARIAGTTAIHVGQLTSLRIESDTGVLLLSIRV
jgi:putative zinc finger protein